MNFFIKINILIFLFSVSAYAETSKHYTSIEGFLRDQQTIRVVAVAEGGYGHLAATANLMNHVRKDLGFKGTFEVIYPQMDFEKMAILFHLPSNAENVYEDKKNKIRFIKLEEQIKRFQNSNIPLVPLGISAAASDDDALCKWAHLSFNDNDTAMCRNVAKLLNVKIYASITHDPHNKNYTGSLFQIGDKSVLGNHAVDLPDWSPESWHP